MNMRKLKQKNINCVKIKLWLIETNRNLKTMKNDWTDFPFLTREEKASCLFHLQFTKIEQGKNGYRLLFKHSVFTFWKYIEDLCWLIIMTGGFFLTKEVKGISSKLLSYFGFFILSWVQHMLKYVFCKTEIKWDSYFKDTPLKINICLCKSSLIKITVLQHCLFFPIITGI